MKHVKRIGGTLPEGASSDRRGFPSPSLPDQSSPPRVVVRRLGGTLPERGAHERDSGESYEA